MGVVGTGLFGGIRWPTDYMVVDGDQRAKRVAATAVTLSLAVSLATITPTRRMSYNECGQLLNRNTSLPPLSPTNSLCLLPTTHLVDVRARA